MKRVSLIFIAALLMGCISTGDTKTPQKTLSQGFELPEGVTFLGSYEVEGDIDFIYSKEASVAIREGNITWTFNRTKGENEVEYTVPEGKITDLVPSSNGKLLIIGTTQPNTIMMINEEGKKIWEHEVGYPINKVEISEDGSLVVAGAVHDLTATLYFVKNGEMQKEYTYPKSGTIHLGPIALTPDGTHAVVGTGHAYQSLALFDGKGEVLWEWPWQGKVAVTKAYFFGVTEVYIADDGEFGASVYDSTYGACFFNEKGVFHTYDAEPCPDIVGFHFTDEYAALINFDGSFFTMNREMETTETKIWKGKILRNDLHGVYGSEITINGVERRINDVKFSEDGEYIVIKADDTELICMTKEGEILWQNHFDQIVDFLPFGDTVIVYNGFSYSKILVVTADGEESGRWNLGKDRFEIGRSPTVGPSTTYKYLYAEKNHLYITTLKNNELYFFKIDLEELT